MMVRGRLSIACAVFLILAGGCAPREPPPATGIRFGAIDPELIRACDPPARLPDRDLGTADVTRLWTADRRSLGLCARRHGGLVRIIELERTGLGPGGKELSE